MDEVFRELTEDVIARMKNGEPRLREVMTLLVRHFHAFLREAALTQDEWRTGIDFLTRTGQICSESRQEFILLSDILGVSMLVDAINNETADGVTDSTVLGPFYAGPQRELANGDSVLLREVSGDPLIMRGRVTNQHGVAVAGAKVEVWQT